MEWFRLYTDLLVNIFLFFSLNLFVSHFGVCIEKEKQQTIKLSFILFWCIYSIIPSIPFTLTISLLTDFLYVLLLTKGKLLTRFTLFVKYELLYSCYAVIIVTLHTLLTFDLPIYATNQTYADYVTIIDSFLAYVTLSMYIILKQLSVFPTGKIYKRYFLGITCVIAAMLIVCSMFLGSTILPEESVVPLFFTLLLIITLLCISIYRRVVSVLEENMRAKIEAEKNAMQQEYAASVEDNLKKLSILRHDFKNHLIVIQGYAENNRREDLLKYVNTLTSEVAGTSLVNTPSTILSTLINAKQSDCERANVNLDFQWDFKQMYLTDFDIVTIISNLLDNALLASRKCEGGFIKLSMIQKGSILEIDCLNNHQEKIHEKQGIFITTKTERPEIHGMGLISVRKTIERLYGEMDIDYTEDRFHVNILVPNYP